MDIIEELKNEIGIIQELYEKEKDLRLKEFLKKLLLETANEFGEIVLQDQAVQD